MNFKHSTYYVVAFQLDFWINTRESVIALDSIVTWPPFPGADVDECLEGMPCGQGAECTNTPGSFTCTCPSGTMQNVDGTRCNGMYCSRSNSTNRVRKFCTTCTHNPFLWICCFRYIQNLLFFLSFICVNLLPPICADFNECEDGSHRCEHDCMNTVGSYTCFCSDSHTNADDGINCLGESFVCTPPPQASEMF